MLLPDLIGRYRLGRRLGSGGFAVVWLAHDESLDTDIAIKVMADNWIDRMDLRERFLMEARMLRRAASNRIVQVFDIGELPDGRPYFVMEYADRGTLADRVKTEPLPLVVALRVTAEVARGAAELHRAGIVHRDLKPSNVLIRSTPDGPERLLIADLGVAKNLAQASGMTMSVGSAGYMAPEQSGPNAGVDVRADVYSLGAIAYRLVTGEVPGLPGFVQWDLPGAPVPVPVRRLLQRAMEVDRERRWPEADSLAVQLDQLADQFSGPQTPPPRGRKSRSQQPSSRPSAGRKSRGRLIAGFAVLLALAGAGAGAFWWMQPVQVQSVTTAATARKQISIEVPRSWGKKLQPNGWDPSVLKLSADVTSGLLVADNDLSFWNDLRKNVNGVFVGVSDDPDLPAAVEKLDHPGCGAASSGQYTSVNGDWTGPIRRWKSCVDSSRSVQEISLTQKDSSVRVYIQIRQYGPGAVTSLGDDDVTLRILDSLRVT